MNLKMRQKALNLKHNDDEVKLCFNLRNRQCRINFKYQRIKYLCFFPSFVNQDGDFSLAIIVDMNQTLHLDVNIKKINFVP